MVFLFLRDDLTQRIGRIRIHPFKGRNLFMQVTENNTLDSDGCSCDRSASKEPCDHTESKAADAAEVVAAAPVQSSSLQHSTKSSAMTTLMVSEMFELIHNVRRSTAGDPCLGSVDTDRAMLSRVINFHHSVAECFACL